jgi:hypothetical protein
MWIVNAPTSTTPRRHSMPRIEIHISDDYAHKAYVDLRAMSDAGILPPSLYVLLRRLQDAIDAAYPEDVPAPQAAV